MPSSFERPLVQVRKHVRRYLAQRALQPAFRVLYRLALAGMNYGGAGSMYSAGDELALSRLRRMRRDSGPAPVIFDVGANVGSYVAQVLRIVGSDALVYSFEPSTVAFEQLRRRFGKLGNIHLVSAGVGSAEGPATLWSEVPGSVLGSTYVNPINGDVQGEPIQLVTIDHFCERHGIGQIDLLKLDLEGGELDALRGAHRLLSAGRIDLIQFEFGQPSLGARTFFADLFGILDERYKLYRVLPRALEPISAYHETLEVFMSTNYLAVSRSRLADFEV